MKKARITKGTLEDGTALKSGWYEVIGEPTSHTGRSGCDVRLTIKIDGNEQHCYTHTLHLREWQRQDAPKASQPRAKVGSPNLPRQPERNVVPVADLEIMRESLRLLTTLRSTVGRQMAMIPDLMAGWMQYNETRRILGLTGAAGMGKSHIVSIWLAVHGEDLRRRFDLPDRVPLWSGFTDKIITSEAALWAQMQEWPLLGQIIMAEEARRLMQEDSLFWLTKMAFDNKLAPYLVERSKMVPLPGRGGPGMELSKPIRFGGRLLYIDQIPMSDLQTDANKADLAAIKDRAYKIYNLGTPTTAQRLEHFIEMIRVGALLPDGVRLPDGQRLVIPKPVREDFVQIAKEVSGKGQLTLRAVDAMRSAWLNRDQDFVRGDWKAYAKFLILD